MGIKRAIATILNVMDGKPAAEGNFDYLKEALTKGSTTTEGGLVLSNVLAVKRTNGSVASYINGLTGNPVAVAAGVENFGLSNETKKIALNHDGSGKLASGNIQWDVDGNASFTGHINAVSGTFSGTVNAASGNIGGLRIENTALSSTPTAGYYQLQSYLSLTANGTLNIEKSQRTQAGPNGEYYLKEVFGRMSYDTDTGLNLLSQNTALRVEQGATSLGGRLFLTAIKNDFGNEVYSGEVKIGEIYIDGQDYKVLHLVDF